MTWFSRACACSSCVTQRHRPTSCGTGTVLVERTGDGPWHMRDWNVGWTGAPDLAFDPVAR